MMVYCICIVEVLYDDWLFLCLCMKQIIEIINEFYGISKMFMKPYLLIEHHAHIILQPDMVGGFKIPVIDAIDIVIVCHIEVCLEIGKAKTAHNISVCHPFKVLDYF